MICIISTLLSYIMKTIDLNKVRSLLKLILTHIHKQQTEPTNQPTNTNIKRSSNTESCGMLCAVLVYTLSCIDPK